MFKQITPAGVSPVVALTLGMCAAPFLAGSASAQDVPPPPVPPPAPPPKWESQVNLGATFSRGNSSSHQIIIGAETKRKWDRDEVFCNAAFGFGETKDESTGDYVKSADYLTAGTQWNHLFTPQLYGGLKLDFRHDDLAALDYRFIVSPLVGYYFVKNDTDTFNVEAGPGFIAEKQGGESKEYFTLRLGERWEHKFSATARFWEQVEILPQIDDFNNFILNAEAGIEAALTKSFLLRLVAQNTYDNDPADGLEKNDFRLIGQIGYKF